MICRYILIYDLSVKDKRNHLNPPHHHNPMKLPVALTSLLLLLTNQLALNGAAQTRAPRAARARTVARDRAADVERSATTLERNIRAHLNFLASDALAGRGSATQFELIAAEYIASQLAQFGIEPAGDRDASGKPSFIQHVIVDKQVFAAAPTLSYTTENRATEFTHGKEILMPYISVPQISGALQKLTGGMNPASGAVVLAQINAAGGQEFQQQAGALLRQGAKAVLVEETPHLRQLWASRGAAPPTLPDHNPPPQSIVVLSAEAAVAVRALADGTILNLSGRTKTDTIRTRNAIGVLRGGGVTVPASSARQAILLSAHLDHLGTSPNEANNATDNIYNGADDDASGVVAVLELARALSRGRRPKRDVYFVCFGSEEKGGYGAAEFLKRPPVALTNIIANLEFEMIGRPDAKVSRDELWLTGFERSDLGSTLARRGARLVADPHPEENFFQRSDNYQLAKRGVIAHTVSSFGLHTEYHQPNDDVAHIDFAHMTRAISSLVEPIVWLANSDFVPVWVEGKRP